MTSTKWAWTLFPKDAWEAAVARLTALGGEVGEDKPIRYLCWGEEVAPETGTRHLQGYVVFNEKKKQRLSGVKKILGDETAHLEVARGSHEQNKAYCSKEGSFTEFGALPPPPGRATSKRNATDWAALWDAATRGDIEDIPAQQRVMYYSSIKRIQMDYKPAPPELKTLPGIWIYGPPGIGKTSYALARWPNAFMKNCNKWWGGYNPDKHKFVVIDDIDKTNASHMGHHLKRWCDHSAFSCESKGHEMFIRPETVILTSNYSIDELWGDDLALCDAITRRMREVLWFGSLEEWEHHVSLLPERKQQLARHEITLYEYNLAEEAALTTAADADGAAAATTTTEIATGSRDEDVIVEEAE